MGNGAVVAPRRVAFISYHQVSLLRLRAIGCDVNIVAAANRSRHSTHRIRLHYASQTRNVIRNRCRHPIIIEALNKPIEELRIEVLHRQLSQTCSLLVRVRRATCRKVPKGGNNLQVQRSRRLAALRNKPVKKILRCACLFQYPHEHWIWNPELLSERIECQRSRNKRRTEVTNGPGETAMITPASLVWTMPKLVKHSWVFRIGPTNSCPPPETLKCHCLQARLHHQHCLCFPSCGTTC